MGSPGTTTRRLSISLGAFACLLAFAPGPAAAERKPLPSPVPVADDALARALDNGRLSPARYALERARSLFHLGAVRREFGHVVRPGPHDATLILRDLAVRLRELAASERREARRLLARPPDGGPNPQKEDRWTVPEAAASPVCDPNICIHWVDTSADAPPEADEDSNDVPDWVEAVVQPTFAYVWSTEIATMDNPAPLSDETSANDGGDGRLDVYLANLGDDLIFGYCASDDPRLNGGYEFYDVSGFCVLDNDFEDFGDEWTPEQFTQVVAAHEFRHASQFAEDFLEDAWLAEGEAMWIEGEVYPDVTDRFDFLDTSAAGKPSRALDHGISDFEYGAWLWFRFLEENFADASIMRDIWERADGSGDSDGGGPDEVGPDQYSMQAVGNATAARGVSLSGAFTTFAQWNRSPARHYEEGAEYPTAPTTTTYMLGPGTPTTGWKAPRLRHLASAYYSFRPRSNASPSGRLRVSVDLPALWHKPAATLWVVYKSGALSIRPIVLDSAGNGVRTVPFGRGTVSRVDLILTNASARYNLSTCWQGYTTYSCGGAIALDENRYYRFAARIR